MGAVVGTHRWAVAVAGLGLTADPERVRRGPAGHLAPAGLARAGGDHGAGLRKAGRQRQRAGGPAFPDIPSWLVPSPPGWPSGARSQGQSPQAAPPWRSPSPGPGRRNGQGLVALSTEPGADLRRVLTWYKVPFTLQAVQAVGRRSSCSPALGALHPCPPLTRPLHPTPGPPGRNAHTHL